MKWTAPTRSARTRRRLRAATTVEAALVLTLVGTLGLLAFVRYGAEPRGFISKKYTDLGKLQHVFKNEP